MVEDERFGIFFVDDGKDDDNTRARNGERLLLVLATCFLQLSTWPRSTNRSVLYRRRLDDLCCSWLPQVFKPSSDNFKGGRGVVLCFLSDWMMLPSDVVFIMVLPVCENWGECLLLHVCCASFSRWRLTFWFKFLALFCFLRSSSRRSSLALLLYFSSSQMDERFNRVCSWE